MKTHEIEKLLAEATPGPWDVDPHGIDDCMGDVWLGEEIRVCENATAANARLIAMAPDLAADNIRLERENERLRKALWDIVDVGGTRGSLAHMQEVDRIARAALEGRDK